MANSHARGLVSRTCYLDRLSIFQIIVTWFLSPDGSLLNLPLSSSKQQGGMRSHLVVLLGNLGSTAKCSDYKPCLSPSGITLSGRVFCHSIARRPFFPGPVTLSSPEASAQSFLSPGRAVRCGNFEVGLQPRLFSARAVESSHAPAFCICATLCCVIFPTVRSLYTMARLMCNLLKLNLEFWKLLCKFPGLLGVKDGVSPS